AVVGDHGAAGVTREGQAGGVDVVGVGEAVRHGRAGRQGRADADAVAPVLEDLRAVADIVVDAGRAAELAHLGAGLHAVLAADQGEVLRVLQDGVGELADPVAGGVLGHRALALGPRLLADVVAHGAALTEDAVAGGADIALVVGRLEEEVEGAEPDLRLHPRAGPNARPPA